MVKSKRPAPRKTRAKRPPSLSPQPVLIKVRTCEELKAVMKVRIRAQVKDPKLLRELEAILEDLQVYGTGGGEEGVLV